MASRPPQGRGIIRWLRCSGSGQPSPCRDMCHQKRRIALAASAPTGPRKVDGCGLWRRTAALKASEKDQRTGRRSITAGNAGRKGTVRGRCQSHRVETEGKWKPFICIETCEIQYNSLVSWAPRPINSSSPSPCCTKIPARPALGGPTSANRPPANRGKKISLWLPGADHQLFAGCCWSSLLSATHRTNHPLLAQSAGPAGPEIRPPAQRSPPTPARPLAHTGPFTSTTRPNP